MRTTPSPPISLGSDDSKPQMSIYVSNLPANCTKQQLQGYFSQFVPGISIHGLRATAARASAFVHFDTPQSLDQVMAMYKANSLPQFENAQIRLERRSSNGGAKSKTQYQFPVYIGRVPKSITDEEIFALVPKTGAARLRRSSTAAALSDEDQQDYRFLFIDCKTLEYAQLCVTALEQTDLRQVHKLRIELAHQATPSGIAEREAVSVFRRSVLFPEVPVGVTKDDMLVVLEVFGRVKRIDFLLPSATAVIDVVPMNLWRVQVDFDTKECALAATNLLQEDGFHNVSATNTRVILDNVVSQPSLPELLDMFSQIGPVQGVEVIKVPTGAKVEFEIESTARDVMQHGPILLRACWIKPELTTLKT